jgi:MOSC domain-containing protein YiiM
MATDAITAISPPGDPSRHLPLVALEAGLARLPAASADSGRVTLVVRRAHGARETLERTRLTALEGVPGDAWSRRTPRDPEAQLAVMRREVAELIANGQPLTMFGDNLFVDIDISVANLPTGTRLRVGEAIVEVTAKPHNGCLRFKGRFGADALRFVQAPATRDQNFRGIYWKVVEPGEVSIGATIQVLSRGSRG